MFDSGGCDPLQQTRSALGDLLPAIPVPFPPAAAASPTKRSDYTTTPSLLSGPILPNYVLLPIDMCWSPTVRVLNT